MYQQHIKEASETAMGDIAAQVMYNAGNVNDNGLFKGRMGIAIFLYHHGQCAGNAGSLQMADQLVDQIIEQIDAVETIGYANGLAGIGAGFEYLSQHGFIEADTNELLYEVDNNIYEQIHFAQAKSLDLMYGITGLAKYCLARYPVLVSGAEQEGIDKTRRTIAYLVDLMGAAYYSYSDLLAVIDLLSEVHVLAINAEKAACYLGYAFNKLETVLYEDLHFDLFPTDFNPLRIMAVCLQAAARTGNPDHYNMVSRIIKSFSEKQYRKNGQPFLGDIRAAKQAVLCKKIAAGLQNDRIIYLANGWMNRFTTNPLALKDPEPGLVNGLSGEGLALLTLTDNISTAWIDHLIVYH